MQTTSRSPRLSSELWILNSKKQRVRLQKVWLDGNSLQGTTWRWFHSEEDELRRYAEENRQFDFELWTEEETILFSGIFSRFEMKQTDPLRHHPHFKLVDVKITERRIEPHEFSEVNDFVESYESHQDLNSDGA